MSVASVAQMSPTRTSVTRFSLVLSFIELAIQQGQPTVGVSQLVSPSAEKENDSSLGCPTYNGSFEVDKHSGNESFFVYTFATGIADCHYGPLSYRESVTTDQSTALTAFFDNWHI